MNISKNDLILGARVGISVNGEEFPSRILGIESIKSFYEKHDWFLLTGKPQWTTGETLSESKIDEFKDTFKNMVFFRDIENYLNCPIIWIRLDNIDFINYSFRLLIS